MASLGNLDFQREKGGPEGLALGVGAQRDGAAATEGLVEQEIERPEVGQFEALDLALDKVTEVAFHAVGGHFAGEVGVVPLVVGDDTDVARVAFVAGAGVGDVSESDSHGLIVAGWRLAMGSVGTVIAGTSGRRAHERKIGPAGDWAQAHNRPPAERQN